MNDYILEFDWKPFAELDAFALLCCQEYNYGNKGKWFNCFRGGLFGFRARLRGVKTNYYELHAWGIAKCEDIIGIENYTAQIFFGMDSAIECVFLL